MTKLGDFTTAHTLSDQELVSGLAHVHTAEAKLAAERLAMVSEMDRRGLGMKLGYSSVKMWYAKAVRVGEGNAQGQIALGYWIAENPTVATALSEGEIHAAHAAALCDSYDAIKIADATLGHDDLASHVSDLLEFALTSAAHSVARRGREIAHRVAADARARDDAERRRRAEDARKRESDDGDGPEPSPPQPDSPHPDSRQPDSPQPQPPRPNPLFPEPPQPDSPRPLSASENTALNFLKIYLLPGGRGRVHGDFDALTIEKLRAILSPLAAPVPQPDGSKDPRSPARRNADGFVDILDRYLAGGAGSQAGPAVRVTLTVRLSDLLKRTCDHPSNATNPLDEDSPFDLEWTGPISGRLAELLTCDAQLTPIIVDDAGVPLAMGRTVRWATAGQRVAIIARDRCCVMCGAPAGWCEAHHVVFYDDGGPTDLNNLALVCGRCHRMIHYDGWQLLMGDDGHPYAIPPATADPERKPIPSFHRRRQRSA